MQAIVLSFDVIVGSYSHLENAPAGGRAGIAVDPGFRDVLNKLLHNYPLCVILEPLATVFMFLMSFSFFLHDERSVCSPNITHYNHHAHHA